MKILMIIFIVLFFVLFLFGNIRVNDMPARNIFQRVKVCIYGSFVITLIIGIPLLGIVFLIGELL